MHFHGDRDLGHGRKARMESHDEQVAITTSRKSKRSRLVLGASALGLLLASALSTDQSWPVRALWFIGGLVCIVLWMTNRDVILGRKTLLVADAGGLHHEKVGLIPWADVGSIATRSSTLMGPTLCVDVRDRDKYIARHPNRFMRFAMRFGKTTSYGFLVLPGRILDRSPDDLKSELERLAGRGL